MKKYTIISAIYQYKKADIYNFIVSINKSGFNGQKIMFIYDGIDNDTESFLFNNGWQIINCKIIEGTILHNQRFIDISNNLDNIDTDVIIFMDARDIIFQKNPIEWLDKHMVGNILATSESLKFKDDDWSTEIGLYFPNEWDWIQNSEIYNCGIIIGKKIYIKDLFNCIYNAAVDTNKLHTPVDQIMFNILIRNKKYKTQFIKQQDGFAIHLAIKYKYPEPYYFTEVLGKVLDNGNVVNDNGDMFYIVHQYDRNETLRNLIRNNIC